MLYDQLIQDPFQTAGIAGFLIYVTTYTLLSLRFMTSEQPLYFALNTLAAMLVLVSLSTEFNLASALIQTFWVCIGLTAITLRVLRRET